MRNVFAKNIPDEEVADPSGWIIDNAFAQFVMMNTVAIQYMCMIGYTFYHGSKVFSTITENVTSYRFISMILTCTGGGILTPIFINSIPVPLANDAYPIAIMISYAIHSYFPILRDVMQLSSIMKATVVILYEVMRASVVLKFTVVTGSTIAPSLFSFPLFGPIMCGTISGCGGAFLPLNKGLEPIKSGLLPPMMTAFIGSTCVHLFLNTSISMGCINAKEKAHVHLALFFVLTGLIGALGFTKPIAGKQTIADLTAKKESFFTKKENSKKSS